MRTLLVFNILFLFINFLLGLYQRVRKSAHAEEQLDSIIPTKMCLDLKTLAGFYTVKENSKEDITIWNKRFGKLHEPTSNENSEQNFSSFDDSPAEYKGFFEEEYLKSWEHRRNLENEKYRMEGK